MLRVYLPTALRISGLILFVFFFTRAYVDLSVLSLLGCSYILTTVLIAPAAAVASGILVTKLI